MAQIKNPAMQEDSSIERQTQAYPQIEVNSPTVIDDVRVHPSYEKEETSREKLLIESNSSDRNELPSSYSQMN